MCRLNIIGRAPTALTKSLAISNAHASRVRCDVEFSEAFAREVESPLCLGVEGSEGCVCQSISANIFVEYKRAVPPSYGCKFDSIYTSQVVQYN